MKREQIRNIFNVQVRNGFLSDSAENGFWCDRCYNGNGLHGGVSGGEKRYERIVEMGRTVFGSSY